MFGLSRSDEVVRELARLREAVDELRVAVNQSNQDGTANLHRVATAISLLADAAQEQERGHTSTTSVVLGLMRLFQMHFGYDKAGVPPYGSDHGGPVS